MIPEYLTFAKNIAISNLMRLPFPYKLTFALTYRCNYRCKTCNIWQRKPENELTLQELQTFFRKSNRFSWIHLTGGEIFLRDDLFDIMAMMVAECPNLLMLNFPTNGFLTDRIVPTVEKIAALKLPKFFITISMDGDEVLNDEIRGAKGGWRRQIETYTQLHAMPGVDAALGMTLSPYNSHCVERIFDAAQRECAWLSYDDFHLNIYHTSSYYGNEHTPLSRQEREALIRSVNSYRARRKRQIHPVSLLERAYLQRVEQFLRTEKTPIRCHALRSSCFLDPKGNVYPCSMYDRIIGNVRERDYALSRIWHSDDTRKIQQEIWNARCPHCWTPCEAYQSILGKVSQLL